MAWTFDEKSPIYAQIMHHIKLQIVSYQIKSGDQVDQQLKGAAHD